MGIGKTTICQILKKQLNNSVFLDGDWCWDSHPFIVTDETKKMVINNICYLLNNFIKSSAFENIIFCWVMHEQSIINNILSNLDTSLCDVKVISLICDSNELYKRLLNDVNKGIRSKDVIEKSLNYLPLYNKLDSVKIDISKLTPVDVANVIAKL